MTDDGRSRAPDGVGRRAEAALFNAAGVGVWAGLLAAGFSQLLGFPALPAVAFAYLYGMSRLRGWTELAGLLSLMAVVVLYFTAYDVIRAAHLGGWGIAGVVVGTAVLAFVVSSLMAVLVVRMRAHALATPPRGLFGRPRQERMPAEDVDRWEAGYFARLRTRRMTGRGYRLLLLRPFAWCGAMFVVAFVADSESVKAVATSVALFQAVVGVRLLTYAKRLQRPGVAEAILWDVRSPVLLLRSFSLDALPADMLDRKRLGLNFVSWLDKRSFEEYLAGEFEQVGPVIAIGRPGETVAPLGAVRDYVGHDAWQERVLAHARAAQCVLMLVDDSPGMAWEIEHVIAAVGRQRVVVVLPPRPSWVLDNEDDDEPHDLRTWDERWAVLRARFAILPEVTAQTGAVLYDDSGQPVLVDAGGSVDERVRAIRTAWEGLRGHTAPAWRPGAVHAAEEALESAWLAIAAALGKEVPQRYTRSIRGRRAVRVGDVPAAVAEVERRLAEVSALLGPGHAVTGALHFLLGRLLLISGDAPRARDELVKATDTLQAETGASDLLANAARRMLGAALAGLGDLDGARREYEAVLDRIGHGGAAAASDASRRVQAFKEIALERALWIQDLDVAPGSPAEAVVRAELAGVCQRLGDLGGARAAYERALPVLDASMPGMSPADQASVGEAHDRYGLVLYALGDQDAARAEHERALTVLRQVLGDGHVLVAVARNNLGLALKALGQRDAARAEYEQAVAVFDAVLGPGIENVGAVDLGNPYANLGTLLYELGEWDAARAQLERAIAVTQAVAGPDDARMGRLRCTYGTILAALGERDAARAELERAVGISERALGADAPETQLFRRNLATVSP